MASEKGKALRDGETLDVGGLFGLSHADIMGMVKREASESDITTKSITIGSHRITDTLVADPEHAGVFYRVTTNVQITRDPIQGRTVVVNGANVPEADAINAKAKAGKERKASADQKIVSDRQDAVKAAGELTAKAVLDTVARLGSGNIARQANIQ